MDSLGVDGAWIFTPRIHTDQRGSFHEWFRSDEFALYTKRRLDVAQINCSVSRRGVIRGIHFSDVPPGQAKFVTCAAGAILDVVVDLRESSPTFGQWASAPLTADGRAVFIEEGLGHAFAALSDQATVLYLCSTRYAPGREHGIHPLDPDLGIAWPTGLEPVLSAKDAAAPTLAEASESGLLPSYAACLAMRAGQALART